MTASSPPLSLRDSRETLRKIFLNGNADKRPQATGPFPRSHTMRWLHAGSWQRVAPILGLAALLLQRDTRPWVRAFARPAALAALRLVLPRLGGILRAMAARHSG